MKIVLQISFFFLLTVQICFAQWAQMADIPTARWGNAACTVDGKIYVLGGSRDLSSPGKAIADMEIYDPLLNSWDATKAPMPTARVMFMAGVVEGKIYAIGGRQTWTTGADLGTVEMYDPLTDKWATKTPMPRPRTNAGICVLDNKIYVIGGIKGGANFIFSNDLQIYDPISDTWDTTKAPMNYARDPYACALDNYIFVIGGTNGPPYAGLHTVEAYDTKTHTWTDKAYTLEGRKGSSAEVIDGKIYALGGEDIAASVTSVEVYDPKVNSWIVLSQTPIWYTMHSSTVFQDKIYLIGGSTTGGRYDNFTPNSTVYCFDPKFAYGTSLDISHKYFPAQGDTLKVTSLLSNLENHQVEVYAMINGVGNVDKDSIELFDDGLHADENPNDNIYGGAKWFSGLEEEFYYVELRTKDLAIDNTHLYPYKELFTTAGPLKVDNITFGALTNFRYGIKPVIKNDGTTLTISNIKIEVYSDDPWVTQIYPSYRTCPNISPGETKLVNPAFAVTYDSATFPGYFNLKFKILSNGFPYWTDSSSITVVTEIIDDLTVAKTFKLEQNYPNPFNPKTTVGFEIPEKANVSLTLLNILGEELRVLLNEEIEAGNHSIDFDASDLPSGVYFYQLRTGSFVETKKMILLR